MATGNKTRVKTVRQQLWHRLDGVWDTNEITCIFFSTNTSETGLSFSSFLGPFSEGLVTFSEGLITLGSGSSSRISFLMM